MLWIIVKYLVLKQDNNWLVVSTHLKNISQNGNLPQIGVKIKNIWNHHLDNHHVYSIYIYWNGIMPNKTIELYRNSMYSIVATVYVYVIISQQKELIRDSTDNHLWIVM